MSERLIVVHPDAHTLAQAVAARLITFLLDRQSVSSPIHVALTGGTVGIATLAAVAASPIKDAVDWRGVHLWWGDERFLPEGDLDRNEVQARHALLDSLTSLPEANIHYMPRAQEDLTVDAAAELYSAELARFAYDGSGIPAFDLILLGMGPDAHVASLFPNHPDAQASGKRAIAVHDSPKPPALRISLTFDVIQSADEVWVIAAGAEKAEAVTSGLAELPREQAPVAAAHGTNRTLWLVDTTAAGMQ
ncbi:6-phosphogluconolactonase [Timonella sp. A28]|uniref:6-phosphogluconolactonase n=1 Tax=Timonella sp. A28 TaxID=3442640 RepID=UPI003EBAC5CE